MLRLARRCSAASCKMTPANSAPGLGSPTQSFGLGMELVVGVASSGRFAVTWPTAEEKSLPS